MGRGAEFLKSSGANEANVGYFCLIKLLDSSEKVSLENINSYNPWNHLSKVESSKAYMKGWPNWCF